MAQDPDAIERDIERTREQLAETIDAIADQVSPRRVAARLSDRAKVALERLRDKARSWPLPPSIAGSVPGLRPAPARPEISGGAATPVPRTGVAGGARAISATTAGSPDGSGATSAAGAGGSSASATSLESLLTRGREVLAAGAGSANKLVRRKDPAAIAAAVTALAVLAGLLRRRRR